MYLLNNSTKTYIEITTLDQEEWIDYDEKDYEITVIGHERVNNYNTTHVVVKVKNTSPKQDLWISKEVPAYKDFYAVKSKYTGKTNLYHAMSKKGMEGFPVRMIIKEKSGTMQMDLVKAEKRLIPSNLLTLEGYQKGALMPGIPAEIDMNKLQNFQNLPAEEQKKIMEELKKTFEQNEKSPKK